MAKGLSVGAVCPKPDISGCFKQPHLVVEVVGCNTTFQKSTSTALKRKERGGQKVHVSGEMRMCLSDKARRLMKVEIGCWFNLQ